MACPTTNGGRNTRRKPAPSKRPPSPRRRSIDPRLGRRYRRRRRRGAVSQTGMRGNMADFGGIAGEQLKSLIERIERLEDEKRALGEDIKEVYAEAKGTGFDPKIMRQLIKIRKMDKDEHDEQESLLDLYKRALGMLPETSARAEAAE